MSGSDKPKPRVPTGISGLDDMLGGGFPAGHVVLVTGLPGTGKTCFGLQFLMAGAGAGEKGVFLSLEEDVAPLLESARQFHWPVDAAVSGGALKILRIDPKETRQSLHRIQGELGKELTSLGARRIVVDSVSLLNMLSDDESGRRSTLSRSRRRAGSPVRRPCSPRKPTRFIPRSAATVSASTSPTGSFS